MGFNNTWPVQSIKTTCELYIDYDIHVVAETAEEFVENVIKIFERFRLYNIIAKPSKVRIGLTSVEYVGRELSHDGTRMQDGKIRKVLDFPVPEYFKQLSLDEYFVFTSTETYQKSGEH